MRSGIVTGIGAFMSTLVLFYAAKLVFQVINGRLLLGRARKNGGLMVKGSNALYKAPNYVVAVISELFLAGVMCRFLIIYKFTAVSFAFITLIAVSLLVNAVIHFIGLLTEKNVYLTESGLIYFLGSFKFSDCRFSWDSSDTSDNLSDKLYIYKGKANYPFVASFEDRETAHRIVNENYVKQQ